ncbi:MAG: hypothetical protein OJF50_000995 [Nitrospira sp.]|nr:hypothetical protein [Nitrospira sp.]
MVEDHSQSGNDQQVGSNNPTRKAMSWNPSLEKQNTKR